MPAVVLVHGGGGTAFAPWVEYWLDKGYAAMAIDTEGHLPVKVGPRKPGDQGWKTIDSLGQPWVGQPGRPHGFADPSLPQDEQWLYHAVADSILAVSYLASQSEIDAGRIGMVGISMGSVVASVVGGIDRRLAFVVPQYIGGNNDLGNVWYAVIKEHPQVMGWDPANFYRNPKGKTQWLWIDGDNDKYGLPPMITRSWRETRPHARMTLLPTQGHGHVWIETGPNAVREIYAFADSVTRGTPALAEIVSTHWEPSQLRLAWRAQVPVTAAQLIYTTEPVPTTVIAGEVRRDWEHVSYQRRDLPLRVMPVCDGTQQATFPLPADMTAGYVNLIDDRGLAVSCEFCETLPRKRPS